MRQLLNKSGILILFFTIIYSVVLLGMSLFKYRSSMISAEGSAMNDNAGDYRLIMEAIILISMLILLNIWSILDFWLESKKSEVFIRRLCGATNGAVMKRIMLNYWFLISISFIMGLIVVWLIKESNFIINKEYIDLIPLICLSTYLIVLMTGVFLGTHRVLRFIRKELIELR